MGATTRRKEQWEDIMKEIEGFPNSLPLEIPMLTQQRLQALLETLDEESDSDDVCAEETIFKLNFKCWVYIKLADYKKAGEINATVTSKTQWRNIISIGNCAFLCWRAGKEPEAHDCLSKLRDLKKLSDFYKLLAAAKAELAYSYSRVAGPTNTWETIKILENIVKNYPGEYFWKLRLGLEYRRATHLNIHAEMPPEKYPLLEFVRRAVNILKDVITYTPDTKLRGPAYCQWAILCRDGCCYIPPQVYQEIFQNIKPNKLCRLALQYGRSNTWVLTTCAKLFRTSKKIHKAISIFEQCLKQRKHSSTFHQLGLCYLFKAEEFALSTQTPTDVNNMAAGNAEKISNPLFRKHFTVDIPLSPNEFSQKAESNFLKAIKMSHGQNLPAMYDLGMLYARNGKNKEALELFNKITIAGGEGQLVTVVNAYEQAGLCYLKMRGHQKFAEDKLTKAIILAVQVASSCPHLKDCATEMWRSFRTMKGRLESEDPSAVRDKNLIRLFELVKKHDHVVKIVEKLQVLDEVALTDPEVIRSGLTSYLNLNELEKALVFLNMISIRSDITCKEWWETKEMVDLRNKVMLLATWQRLQVQRSEARSIFQELFKMYIRHSEIDEFNETTNTSTLGDVLLFYDGDNDNEFTQSQVSMTAQVLHSIFSEVFGLATNKNLNGCPDWGPLLSLTLEHTKRYPVLVIVLGPEPRYRVFEVLLEIIPHPSPRAHHLRQSVLIIDAGCGRAAVPEALRACDYLQLPESILRFIQQTREKDGPENQMTADDVIKNIGGNLEAIMQLFCFVVKQKWPCG